MGQKHATPRLAAAVTVVGGTLVVGGQPVSADAFVVTTLNDVLDTSDGVLSLREAVNAANDSVGADSISFAPALAGEIVLSDQLPIAGDLSIVGPGADVLTLRSDGRTLYVYGVIDFELSGVTVTSNGRAVHAPSGADVSLDSVAIVESDVAVAIEGGTLSVARSRFIDNGAGVVAAGVSDLNVADSLFDRSADKAIDVQGEVIGETTVRIADSTFTSNDTAVYLDDMSGSASITGTSLVDNTDEGIHIRDNTDVSVVLDDVELKDNRDDSAQIRAERGLMASNLTVSGNTNDGMSVDAGSSDVHVSLSTFSDNAQGLAIETSGDVDVVDSTFATSGGGLYIREGDQVSMVRTSFESNDVYGFHVYANDVVLTDVSATDNLYGAAIEASNSLTVAHTDVSRNTNSGLKAEAGGDIEISESEFSDNGGGGLDLEGRANLTLQSVIASRNGESGVGADFRDSDDSLVVEGFTAIDNGGAGLSAFGSEDGHFEMSDSTIVGGELGVDAGYNASNLTMTGVSVSDADFGLFLSAYSEILLSDVEVSGSGEVGITGIVFEGVVELDGLTLVDNAEGALEASAEIVSIVNSTITGNGFDENGATMSFDDGDVSIAHSTITANTLGLPNADTFCPDGCPGVIFRDVGSVSIEHSIVTGNVDEAGVDGFITIPRQTPPPASVEHSVTPERAVVSGTNVAADDPLLGPLADNGGLTRTMLPLSGSPALDAGDPAFVGPPGVDQRGLPRPAGRVDIGAVEVQGGVVTGADVSVVEDLEVVDVVLTRSGDPDTAVTVDVALVDGTAVSPADFGAVSPVSVSWLPGEVGDQVVSVPIVADGVIEGPETFQVVVSTVSPIEDVSEASATVTIRDNGDVVSSLTPARFVDTRDAGDTFDDLFEAEGKRVADSEYVVDIAGRGGVPADAKAVVVNVTAVAAEGVGFVTAHPCLDERPLASSLNYTPGVNLANEIIAPLSADGEVCLYTSEGAHLLVDVVGYVGADSPLVPVDPARYLDTRAAGTTFDGNDQQGGRTSAAGEVALQVAGRGAVPADAAAVVVNVTAVGPTETGFVTVHPCVGEPPNASSLNYVAGVNRANELIASVNDDGEICLFTSSSINVLVDVVGYIPAGTALTPVAPSRFLDTRAAGETIDGLSEAEGKRSADSEYELQVAGRAGVPESATAVVMNVTAVAADGVGFVTVHPCVDPRPNASSLNYVAGVNGANELVASLDDDGNVCLYTSENTHLLVDVVADIT